MGLCAVANRVSSARHRATHSTIYLQLSAPHWTCMLQSDHVETAGKSVEEIKAQLQLILLDFGLAEELTPKVCDHVTCDGLV